MAKWKLDKSERKTHEDGAETVTYEAKVYVPVEEGSQPTLADVATLVGNLTTVDGVPTTAKLGTTIDTVLTWTDADLA